jgi:hypothetical protein
MFSRWPAEPKPAGYGRSPARQAKISVWQKACRAEAAVRRRLVNAILQSRLCKRPPRSGFQILLKRERAALIRKCDVGFYAPRPIFRTVSCCTRVVCRKTGLQIIGDANVEMPGIFETLQEVNVFHVNSHSAKARSAHPLPSRRLARRAEASVRRRLVGLGRLELPTSPLSGARSSHLSYRPNASRDFSTCPPPIFPSHQKTPAQ